MKYEQILSFRILFRQTMATCFIKLVMIFAFSMLQLCTSTTLACSCISLKSRSLYDEFKETDYIFIGTVTNITTTSGMSASRDVQFRVDEHIKGPSNSGNVSMLIYTPKERSACGIKMKLNERWQIWADYTDFFSDDSNPKWLTAFSCGRSTNKFNRNLSLLCKWSCYVPN